MVGMSPPAPDPMPRLVPTPERLRGLAHPLRLRALDALRLDGPSTATALARRLGVNSGATSYHLRQLASYGYIEEATELGTRRDRYWRARHSEAVPEGSHGEGTGALAGYVLVGTQLLQESPDPRAQHCPSPGAAAGCIRQEVLDLTAGEAKDLSDRIVGLVEQVRAAARDAPGHQPRSAYAVRLCAVPVRERAPAG